MTTQSYTKQEVASWPEGHKRCSGCQEVLPFVDFHKQKQTLFGLNNYCKKCRKPLSAKNYAKESRERRLWYRAKRRARAKGLPFTITEADIQVPEFCPILGVPLTIIVGENKYSPSLDQIEPGKGYTPDNIQVISNRANMLKNNATVDEIDSLFRYMFMGPLGQELKIAWRAVGE
jgi:hypothetical protein